MDQDGFQFEDGLNQMAVIRTTFETLEYFPDDEPMREELPDVLENARFELGEWLYAYAWQVETTPEAHGIDWSQFHDYALELITRGYPGRSLDVMMRGAWFGNERFYLELSDDLSVDEVRAMDGHTLFVRLLRMLHSRVTDRANSVDLPTFNRTIFQPFVALLFINYGTSDPQPPHHD